MHRLDTLASLNHACRHVLSLGLLITLPALPALARANGAFPDSAQLLLPRDRTDIVIGTNFGLIMSGGEGEAWHWVCETEITSYGKLYQLGQNGRLLGISTQGLVFSDDGACSWEVASGTVDPATDAFVDPAAPERVLAIAGPLGVAQSLYESRDGGRSFGPALRTLPSDRFFTSVETAQSDAERIYVVSQRSRDLLGAALEVSDDGGVSWDTRALPNELGDAFVRIISVDPANPDRLLLRVSPPFELERLAVSTDAGRSYTTPMPPVGVLTGFVRRDDGSLVVTASVDGQGLAYTSDNRGDSFRELPLPLELRAIAERDGVLYGAADNTANGVALARSRDDGESWEPVMAYQDVQAIKECAQSACQESCSLQAELWALWSPAVCEPGVELEERAGDSGAEDESATGAGCGVAWQKLGTTARQRSGESLAPRSWSALFLFAASMLLARGRRVSRTTR